VPVSNTLLFTRGMVTVPAALAEMSTRRFVVLSALGTLSFEGILALATVYGADVLGSL
jgi:membrane protein DedA with SNARE-associated domain